MRRRLQPRGDRERGLAGRTAVVTGGARNIGFAIASALRDAGASVVLIDSDGDALSKAARKLGCAALEADLTGGAEVAARLLAEHGSVELIVNNVGITTRKRFRELGEEDFDLILSTNLRGPWFFTRALVEPLIAERKTGAILFVSSIHSSHVRLNPHYSASKAAVAMLVRELAHELGPQGIRVNALSPGWIGEWHEEGERKVALRRAGTPEDVAPMAVALLDDAVSGYVTGADVAVDGGLSLHSWLD
jgi:NAD(P)-dependent dehydrogenase (short-subunit alcohol dehydrogenase family)